MPSWSERIGALTGKVAVIGVGAPTPAALKETQRRVADALSATRAALAEGVVAGGGAAPLHAERALDDLEVTGDYAIGVDIVRRSLTEPACLIASNAGYIGQEIVAKTVSLAWTRVSTRWRDASRTWSRSASSTRCRWSGPRCRTARRSPGRC